MLHDSFTRTKAIRMSMIVSILVLLTILLLVGDTFLAKFHPRRLSNSCIICSYERNVTYYNNTRFLHFSIYVSGGPQRNAIDVLFFFANVNRNPGLKHKLTLCFSSLFNHAQHPLHLHIITDSASLSHAFRVLKETTPLARTSVQVSLYDVNMFMEPLQELVDTIRPYFSYRQGAYYSDSLFYISIGLFRVMNLERLLVIDADVKFLDDVKYLYDHFEKFPPKALIGIAREQQPVYRHVLNEYRRLYNDTKVGGPPPDGIPGFNSGILLLDLERMRNSELYTNITKNLTIVLQLIEKFKFKGHLGDQDFYTIINLEYPTLFYRLPCSWNRQLCQWWKRHGYKDIFDLYHNCTGKIHLLHGNCNTVIPEY